MASPVEHSASSAQGRANRWGHLPFVMVIMTVGLFMVGVADAGAWRQETWAVPLFYPGLAIIYAAPAFRMLSAGAHRRERLALVLMLGMALYAVKVMHEPTMFTFHDELGHVRTTSDILTSRHLFSNNPIVSAYSYYPGMEIVTAVLVKLTGLSILQAGVLLVAAARFLLAGSLFWLMEEALGSTWLAGIAALIYMANPGFLFFDAQFAYESLALPMATMALWLIARWIKARRRATWVPAVLAAAALAAVVPTHHMTSYAVVATLAAWTVASVALRRQEPQISVRRVIIATALSLALVLDWNRGVAGAATLHELGAIPHQVLGGLHDLVLGSLGGKHLFQASAGQAAEPRWGQVLGFASVLLILLALPVGIWALRGAARRSSFMLVLGAAAVLYPVSLVPRLTQGGTETSARAAEFVFFGVAAVVAGSLLLFRLGPPRGSSMLPSIRQRVTRALVTVGMTVVFIGGFIVSWAPWSRLPGPYLPAAGDQSVGAQGVAAAVWARDHLPPESRIATDETDATLMGAYGELDPQGGLIDGLRVSSLFFSPTFGSDSRRIIRRDKLEYIVVDKRLAGVLPLRGFYFEADEPNAYAHFKPLSRVALEKFNNSSLAQIYDNGDIAIYDTRALLEQEGGS